MYDVKRMKSEVFFFLNSGKENGKIIPHRIYISLMMA